MTVSVALIAGPMYEALYAALDRFSAATGVDVSVDFRGDHPSLNRHLASAEARGHDLVSTHIKYAPAQRGLLAPLDRVLDADALDDFLPLPLSMARVDGELLGVPRVLDVRLFHRRTDLVPAPARSWDEVLVQARQATRPGAHAGYVFPGRESGLFGTFYELSAMAGAPLFTSGGQPDLGDSGGGARWALEFLRAFHAERVVPAASIDWHYDEVSACFRAGAAAMVADWPGSYRAYQDPAVAGSQVADRFAIARYPAGPSGRSLAYAGCHTWALTRRGAASSEARELLRVLASPDAQWLDVEAGSLPVRRSLMERARRVSSGAQAERWRILAEVAADGLLMPPMSPAYPELEAKAWRTLQAAIAGRLSPTAALEALARDITAMGPLAAPAGASAAHSAAPRAAAWTRPHASP